MQAEFHLRRERTNQLEYGWGTKANRSIHFHSQIEIYFVLEGEIGVWINDKYRLLHANEISVSFSYDAHGYREETPSRFAYLVVPTDLLHEFLPMFTERQTGDPFISDPEIFQKAYAAFCEIPTGANELAVRGYVYVILGILSACLPLEVRVDLREPRSLARLLMYINEHFRGELTLTDLAAAFGYNPSYLSRNFRETFGISFSRYVTMLRLREAILLLGDGGRSITACALESGFGSLRSFYRAFYDEFHCTPTEYLHAGEKKQI